MILPNPLWYNWAQWLKARQSNALVASLLEAFAPLTVIGAQVVYLSQPLFHFVVPDEHLKAIAETLEDSQYTQAFINYLREEKQP
ncbi:MAG: hypothetical protein OHK0052_27960 [Anaerolineales bacterium]